MNSNQHSVQEWYNQISEVELSTSGSVAIHQSTKPIERADSSPLQNGDRWYKTEDNGLVGTRGYWTYRGGYWLGRLASKAEWIHGYNSLEELYGWYATTQLGTIFHPFQFTSSGAALFAEAIVLDYYVENPHAVDKYWLITPNFLYLNETCQLLYEAQTSLAVNTFEHSEGVAGYHRLVINVSTTPVNTPTKHYLGMAVKTEKVGAPALLDNNTLILHRGVHP